MQIMRRALTTAALVALVMATPFGQARSASHWVATWTTAVVARPAVLPPAAAPAAPPAPNAPAPGPPPITPNNQTLREIVHTSVGGTRARVVFANTFGTSALNIGGASIALYLLTVIAMLLGYLGLRLLVNSHFGYVVVGVRDDVERTRMLGYNVARMQVTVFALAAGLAGLSGVLYVSWGNYINPSSMGLYAATLPVIWTAVGGRSSLIAVTLSTVALKWLADSLAVRGGEYAFLIMGALLLATMLFFPAGIVVSLNRLWRRARRQAP